MELNLLTCYVTVFPLHLFTHLSNHTGDVKAETIAYCHSGTSHGTTCSNSHVASSTDKTYGSFPNVINRRIVFVAQSAHNRSKNTRGTGIPHQIIRPTIVGLLQNFYLFLIFPSSSDPPNEFPLLSLNFFS